MFFNSFARINIKKRKDLTKLLGYDFNTSNIEDILISSKDNILCVILNDNFEKFGSDLFVKNEFFSTDYQGQNFKHLKNIFPEFFQIEYSEIKNNFGARKDLSINYLTFEVQIPYSIYWFSSNFNGDERIVIYAVLPDEIKSISCSDKKTIIQGKIVE